MVRGFYAKQPEPALESCMSPEMWRRTYDITVQCYNGEIRRSAGVIGRMSRMSDLRGYSPAELCINKGGTAEYSVPDGGWNLRRTTLL